MNQSVTAKPLIDDAALDRLWRKARSFNDFTAQPVTDAELRALYDLAKWGPTTANSQPQRVVFVRSAAAKERLAPALSSQNRKKALGATVRCRAPI
jgi:3-hydroxypropanoate dehydrogenase